MEALDKLISHYELMSNKKFDNPTISCHPSVFGIDAPIKPMFRRWKKYRGYDVLLTEQVEKDKFILSESPFL